MFQGQGSREVRMRQDRLMVLAVLITLTISACAKKQPAVARPMPPPPTATGGPTGPPPPPQPVSEPIPVPPEPVSEDSIAGRSLDDLNRDSPLKPLFFLLDSRSEEHTSELQSQSNLVCRLLL